MSLELTTERKLDTETTREAKCAPGQGKLNRSIKPISKILVESGHSKTRFVRNYELGTARYECAHCGETATVMITKQRGKYVAGGPALMAPCNKGVKQ